MLVVFVYFCGGHKNNFQLQFRSSSDKNSSWCGRRRGMKDIDMIRYVIIFF